MFCSFFFFVWPTLSNKLIILDREEDTLCVTSFVFHSFPKLKDPLFICKTERSFIFVSSVSSQPTASLHSLHRSLTRETSKKSYTKKRLLLLRKNKNNTRLSSWFSWNNSFFFHHLISSWSWVSHFFSQTQDEKGEKYNEYRDDDSQPA